MKLKLTLKELEELLSVYLEHCEEYNWHKETELYKKIKKYYTTEIHF